MRFDYHVKIWYRFDIVVYFDPLLLQVQKIELLRDCKQTPAKQNETTTLRQPRHMNDGYK